jgi:predicted Holliday junction resolvase-like endonuclease
MTKASSKALIAELKRNKSFMGTCPACQEEFRLSAAPLFSIEDEPPAAGLAAIEAARQAIRERKDELACAKMRMTERAQSTAEAVNLGKIVEKIVPSFTSFGYPSSDCRALFEPVDYLIFSGLTGRRKVDALYFVDVKSGAARLTAKQRGIKDVVDAGRVSFKLTKMKG